MTSPAETLDQASASGLFIWISASSVAAVLGILYLVWRHRTRS